MHFKNYRGARIVILGVVISIYMSACQKTGTTPSVPKAASLTVVNAIPGSAPITPVVNSGSPINYFAFAASLGYGGSLEYSPPGGNDTTYVIQGSDTSDIGPKSTSVLFYNILKLSPGGIYSLFLTGTDTNSVDYLLTYDSIPFYGQSDSVVGIRFVNLSTGSNPISINLEGSPNGSEVGNLSYKGITNFRPYLNNSSISDYLFVVRDVATGDSLTQFDFVQVGSYTNGNGLIDPNTNKLLTFKCVTVAVIGSESSGSSFPIQTVLIDDY